MNKMLDISVHQVSFDGAKARAQGIQAVFCRCAYGTSTDKKWSAFYPQVKNNGMKLGAYGFLTAHYKSKNNSNLNTALSLTKSQVQHWINLCKAAGAEWLAVDQELEGGQQMGLSIGDNTTILKTAVDMISAAGLKPLVYCSASWVKTNIKLDVITCPLWIAYYPTSTASTNFTMYTNGTFPNTTYGRMMNSWKDKGILFAWQYGSTGWGATYGMGSANLDRNWQYLDLNGGLVEVTDKQLVVTSAEKPACEYFGSEDVYDGKGFLPLGGTYRIIAQGSTIQIGGMTGAWYKINYEGREVYVLALPDRCKIEDYVMKFTSIEGKELKALAEKPRTQVFTEPDVDKVDTSVADNGYLSPDGTYTILKVGEKETVGGMEGTWYIIKVDGKEVYCLQLPDRAIVQDIPKEPEPEPTPEPKPEPQPDPEPADKFISIVIPDVASRKDELETLLKNNNYFYKIYKEM